MSIIMGQKIEKYQYEWVGPTGVNPSYGLVRSGQIRKLTELEAKIGVENKLLKKIINPKKTKEK